jgi:hypothetical protein
MKKFVKNLQEVFNTSINKVTNHHEIFTNSDVEKYQCVTNNDIFPVKKWSNNSYNRYIDGNGIFGYVNEDAILHRYEIRLS